MKILTLIGVVLVQLFVLAIVGYAIWLTDPGALTLFALIVVAMIWVEWENRHGIRGRWR